MRAITITPEGERKLIEYDPREEYGEIKKFIDATIDVVRMRNMGVDMYIDDEGKYTRSNEQNYLGTLLRLIDLEMPSDYIDGIFGPIVIVGPPDHEGWSTDLPQEFINTVMTIDHGVVIVDCNGVPLTGLQMLGDVDIPVDANGVCTVSVSIKRIPDAVVDKSEGILYTNTNREDEVQKAE